MDALHPSATGPSDAERLERIHAAMPEGGLFAGKDWLWSPRPFVLSKREWQTLEKLGPLLWKFVHACDSLYHRSAKGKLPAWIASYADAGKPAWLIEAARANHREGELPRVLRPDLVLTAGGFAMSELDSVPGGIGLLGWLNRTHAALGDKVIGGPDGMLEGFASLFDSSGVIAVSKESADYRPEMEWLAARLRENDREIAVEDAETLQPDGREIYRFFELFDWENLPSFRPLLDAWKKGAQPVTAPFKPWLDEKLWLALLWSAPLQEHWDLLMRRAWKQTLQSIVPFGWVVDPTPLPPHGVLPRLGVQSWDAVAALSQKHRELVLKVSGFHPLAWGARSVSIGHDLPQTEWAEVLRTAQVDFPRAPWILQEFHHARIVRHPYQDRTSGAIVEMEAKARITPYYFAGRDGKIRLGGVHATLCPSDKKILHGMSDAIMVPCVVEE